MRSGTHSFSTLPVSPAVYGEIEALLRAAGYGHVFVNGAIDMMGMALVVSPTSPRGRGDFIHELVFARAWNNALAAAAALFDDPVDDHHAAAIRALEVPYRLAEDEARFARRDVLTDQTRRTPAEEAELQALRRWIAQLPTGRSLHDQQAIDVIHETAALLRKHA